MSLQQSNFVIRMIQLTDNKEIVSHEINDKIFDLLALERINQKLRTISESIQSVFSS